jgi:tRNA A-37 threonylcarbamoyl transferase component Bud32
VVFAPGAPGGTLTVNPAFAPLFAQAGLKYAAGFLNLPGEVVSGHADRHVARIEIPGAPHALYLKRQHVVGPRERLRNRLAGFGWVSRCEREAVVLQQLEAEKLPAPRWAAFGTHEGRAFLLVEEVPGAIDLRRVLAGAPSPVRRCELATRLGATLAAVHAAGFATPDLSAKHVLVNPETLAIAFLDWQSATRHAAVSESARADALGALSASLTGALDAPDEWMGVLTAYRKGSAVDPQFAAAVARAGDRHAKRRSVRDQLQPAINSQRLVWLAGEAVCAIPDVAAVWPRPAIAPPFYGFGPDGSSRIRFAGRDAVLIRGCSSAPFGRFRAWLRAVPWRSPGVTAGRVLFHLERYGVPASRLLAFGQRFVSGVSAEWFAMYEAPPGVPLWKWRWTAPSAERRAVFDSAAQCLQKLHDSGCVLTDPKTALAVCAGHASIGDPRAVRIVRRVSDSARRSDLRNVARLLEVE